MAGAKTRDIYAGEICTGHLRGRNVAGKQGKVLVVLAKNDYALLGFADADYGLLVFADADYGQYDLTITGDVCMHLLVLSNDDKDLSVLPKPTGYYF